MQNLRLMILGSDTHIEDPIGNDPKLAQAMTHALTMELSQISGILLEEISPASEVERRQAQELAWATGNAELAAVYLADRTNISKAWSTLQFVGRPSSEMSVGVYHRRTNSTIVRVEVCVQLAQQKTPICAIGEGASELEASSFLFQFTPQSHLQESQGNAAHAMRQAIQAAVKTLFQL
jgi:hypothetical protein